MTTQKHKIGFEVLLECIFFLLIPIAIMPKPVQLGVYALICILMIASRPRVKFDNFAVFMVLYMGIYAVSIIRRLWVDDIPMQRILGTVNLYALWIFAIILYLYFLNMDVPLDRIGRAALFNVLIMCLFGVLAVVISKVYGYPNEILILRRKLYYWEWTSMRFMGLFDYPTQVTIFEMLMYPWGSMYVRKRFNKSGRLAVILFTLAGFFPVFLCRSRTGYLLYWIPVLILPLMGIIGRIKRSQIKGFVIFCGVVAAIFVVFNLDLCKTVVEKLLNMREGSQFSRNMIYSGTWEKIKETPILGYGVKVQSAWIQYVLGSHSSYLGFLYKTGILGCAALIYGFVCKIRDMYRVSVSAKSVYASWIILAILATHAFFVLEDMDGVNWLLCTWFAVLGLVGNRNFKEYDWEQTTVKNIKNSGENSDDGEN